VALNAPGAFGVPQVAAENPVKQHAPVGKQHWNFCPIARSREAVVLWWSCITGSYKCIAIQQPSATLLPRGSQWRSRWATDAAYAIPSVTPWPRHPKRQSVSRPIISGDTRMPANRPQSLETYPVSPVSWGISSISMAQAVKADSVPGDTTLHQRSERFLPNARAEQMPWCFYELPLI
jgi:hypothetical protein